MTYKVNISNVGSQQVDASLGFSGKGSGRNVVGELQASSPAIRAHDLRKVLMSDYVGMRGAAVTPTYIHVNETIEIEKILKRIRTFNSIKGIVCGFSGKELKGFEQSIKRNPLFSHE